MNFETFLAGELERIQRDGLYRSLRVINSPQGPEVSCDGRLLANFASNDYLGLATHRTFNRPRARRSMSLAAARELRD
jgi:7-keto-8-aminopelargonate synthetase-like enzyme